MVFPTSRTGCSRVPRPSATLTAQYCYLADPVRLACLIHATSVRSEPESNSQKKNLFKLLKPLAGFRASQQAYLFIVFRVPSEGSHLGNRGIAFFSTVHFSKINRRAPFGVALSGATGE